jgi:membrane protein implicated in regulation of membrane protease activity
MFYIWLAIVILLTIVEFLTVNLTTIWFVLSALVALLLSFVTDNFLLQFTAFVVLGVVLLITTRPALLKLLVKHKEKTNIDRVIGMRGIVTEEIKKNNYGEVKVDGKRWTAYADKKIKVDAVVKILEINGVKLKVEEDGE